MYYDTYFTKYYYHMDREGTGRPFVSQGTLQSNDHQRGNRASKYQPHAIVQTCTAKMNLPPKAFSQHSATAAGGTPSAGLSMVSSGLQYFSA